MGNLSMPAQMTTATRVLSPEGNQHLGNLRSWFPGVVFWFGGYTGRWWAMLPGGLVDAETAEELARLLTVWGVRATRPVVSSRPVSVVAETRPQQVVRPEEWGGGGR